MSPLRAAVFLIAALLVDARISLAGQVPSDEPPDGNAEVAASAAIPLVADAPPPPVAPATISRDEEGRATIRAVRLSEGLRIDGRLDERHYADIPPMSGFLQVEPGYGVPAVDQTDLWVSFDDDNVYVSARMWDDDGQLIATEMRRDSDTMFQGNDLLMIIFDTFYDRRNGMMFYVNPIGGRSDTQVTGERQMNRDWNPLWEVETGRFDGGWTVEMSIPFKSLRYRPGTAQVWGFNALRAKRSTNEMSLLTRVPLGRQQASVTQTAFAATMVGLEAPPAARNIDIKPYAISSLTTNRTASAPVVNDPNGDVGLDVKYAVTQGLTADVTVNTDFAQVEADEQQVNLTRFSLFFPEKREFFLENQGTFGFGGVQLGGNSGGGQNSAAAPILFYSRRIGLNQGREVPLRAGGRISGRVGRYTMGILTAQTGDETDEVSSAARATNFSVFRLRRDILRRSAVGVIATGRSVAQNGVGRNLAYGADGSFLFFDNLAINTYWAKTETDGRSGDDTSYRAELNQNGDRYGLQLERLVVGANFNPEVGFLPRGGFRKSAAQFRFSPRPRRFPSIRRFRYQGGITYVDSGAGVLETRERDAEFAIEFQNGDQFAASLTDAYEFLPAPFRIANGVTLPVGGYSFQTGQVRMELGRQRRVSARISLEHGSFYNGRRTSLSISRGRLSLTNALSIEPSYSMNRVDLVQGEFTTHLVSSRITYTMTPLMFASALVQYNSGTNSVSTNARLRWEYHPGSELFIVYNEERNTLARSFPETSTRALIVKVNRLLRF